MALSFVAVPVPTPGARGWRDLALGYDRLIAAFPHLPEALLVELAQGVAETFLPGETIVRQGEPADAFYLVRLGFVKVSERHPGGDVILTYLGRGAYFGEMGLLGAGHRFLLHAGAEYAGPLAGRIGAELPLRGMSIGRRLAWYRGRLAALDAREDQMANTLTLPALEVRQGHHTLYCFAVDGKQLAQFTAVSRLGRGDDGTVLGYQRPEVLRHVRQMTGA